MTATSVEVLLVAVTAALLAGCSARAPDTQSAAASTQGSASYVHVSELQLPDGTRCVVADYHGTGITCEWEKAPGVAR